ncbi:MAG: hypothetical protein HYZ50_12505 [Deltaproteobacteria bacterium]|nr:hypothetical protein [Deltaproteobacteria bacterium]
MTVFTLLLSLSLFLWSHTAQAAVLCTKKGGAVFLREACKAHETPVDPVALGLRGPGAVVKDTNNNFVGVLSDVPFDGGVLRQVGPASVRFAATLAGLSETSTNLEHESTDCSGPGFRDFPPESVLQLTRSGVVRGSKVYYVSGPPRMAAIRSWSESPIQEEHCSGSLGFIPPDICCYDIGYGPYLRSPMGELDLSHLVPPFHVEVQE